MGWTQSDLIDFCKKNGISSASYSLYSDADEAFCIEKIGEEWLIYYSERGKRNELAWGKNEAQAINLLKLFLLEAHNRI